MLAPRSSPPLFARTTSHRPRPTSSLRHVRSTPSLAFVSGHLQLPAGCRPSRHGPPFRASTVPSPAPAPASRRPTSGPLVMRRHRQEPGLGAGLGRPRQAPPIRLRRRGQAPRLHSRRTRASIVLSPRRFLPHRRTAPAGPPRHSSQLPLPRCRRRRRRAPSLTPTLMHFPPCGQRSGT